MKLCMNTMKNKVHANAVKHGWWEAPCSIHETFALVHSELSEALEEDRAGRPMVWHECLDEAQEKRPTICECCANCWKYSEKEKCKNHSNKPEGVAVELIDYCIRLLDLAGYCNLNVDIGFFDEDKGKTHYSCDERIVSRYDLPTLISKLHLLTSDAYQKSCFYNVAYAGSKINECIATVYCWLDAQGVDADKVMLEKHKYNTGRPYKHGKKY